MREAISNMKFCLFSIPLRATVPMRRTEESSVQFNILNTPLYQQTKIILVLLPFPWSLFSITCKLYMMPSRPWACCWGAAGRVCSTEESSESRATKEVWAGRTSSHQCFVHYIVQLFQRINIQKKEIRY